MPVIPASTALLVLGITYLVMPAATLALLAGRHDARSTLPWCAGGMAMGAALLLLALRAPAAGSTLSLVAFALGAASYALRGLALQREHHGQASVAAAVLPTLAGLGLQILAAGHSAAGYVTVGGTLHAIALAILARQCWRLALHSGLRSPRLMAWSYAGLALFIAGRLLLQALGRVEAQGLASMTTTGPVILAWLLTAVYGNLGFLGLALERLRESSLQQTRALAYAQANREAAERQSQTLARMLGEREDMLRLLAHEVRQPLNNAQAALQSAESVLDARHAADAGSAGAHVRNAQAVIGEAVGTLDNTLAAASLLSSGTHTARHDEDILILIELVLADLPAAERARVGVERISPVRTARFDPALLRLALRNLLLNALAYAPPGSPVRLSVADQEDPLALVFEVADLGPGVAPGLRPRLFLPGVRGSHSEPGHGMGLYIVRRVAELHGGSVALRDNAPRGSVFRLELPQGVE